MPFFDLIIRWVESSDFGPKSDDLGHRILKSDFIPSDFAKIRLHKHSHPFCRWKIKITSSESDRIINGLNRIRILEIMSPLALTCNAMSLEAVPPWSGTPSATYCYVTAASTAKLLYTATADVRPTR